LRTFGPTALTPEEVRNETEGGDDLVGIDFFALPVGGPFFRRLEFDRLAFHDQDGLRSRRISRLIWKRGSRTRAVMFALISGTRGR
jgi:hypothetical protein